MPGFHLALSNFPTPELNNDLPIGLPPDPDDQQRVYAEQLYEQRQRILGASRRDGEGDVEDFWENAARLDAALQAGVDEVWLRTDETRLVQGVSASNIDPETRVELPPSDSNFLYHYGPIPEFSSFRLQQQLNNVDDYPRWPAFVRGAGRRIALAGVHLNGEGNELATLLSSWVQEGVVGEDEKVVVKSLKAKHGLYLIQASSDSALCQQRIDDVLGWNGVYFEGVKESFSVQQQLAMTYEYRLFIVDGKIVTGAGCIEEYTPLWARRDSAFDDRMRRRRPGTFFTEAEVWYEHEEFDSTPPPIHRDSIECRPDLLETYLVFATELITDLPPSLVIDVAWDEQNRRAVMIEANSLSNAGLYASRPELVAQALAAIL